MKFDKKTLEQLRAYCGELREDDGVDPRKFFNKQQENIRRRDQKTNQLCKQVAQTLNLVLSGEFGDELLHNLEVVSVEPAPNASQMLVSVRSLLPVEDQPAAIVLKSRLESVVGVLRTAVASAITRKKAPRLSFQVVGGETEVSS